MFCVLATLCNQTDHFFNWFELYLLNLLLLHEFLSNGEKCVVGDGMQELAVFLLRAPAHLVFAVMALHLSEREGTWWRRLNQCHRRPGRKEPHNRESSSWPGQLARGQGCSVSASVSPPRSVRHPPAPCRAPLVVRPERLEVKSVLFSSSWPPLPFLLL